MIKNLLGMIFPIKPNNKPIKPKPKVSPTNTINYIYNDPTTPSLSATINIPTKPNYLDFSVRGFTGRSGSLGSSEFQAANVFTTLVKSMTQAQSYSPRRLLKWPGTNRLSVNPRAGKDLNAYYDRRHLNFFYEKDPTTNQMIYAADSLDVVAHELGHGVLDVARPDLYSYQAIEIWAFHEAFADINAMLTIMQEDIVINYALNETNGNMRTTNVITKLGEQFGLILYNLLNGGDGSNPSYLRNALNSFLYIDPSHLPQDAPYNQLSQDPHSFAQVFVGAWWDCFAAIYEKVLRTSSQKNAFIVARNTMARYLWTAIYQAPANARFYQGMARAILAADRASGSVYQTEINTVFINRHILSGVSMLSTPNIDKSKVLDNKCSTFRHCHGMSIRKEKSKTIKLCDCFPIRSMSNNPLYNVHVQIPMEEFYEYDQDGNLVDHLIPCYEDTLNHAQSCINYINDKKLIGNNQMFKIENGYLKRNYIRCCL